MTFGAPWRTRWPRLSKHRLGPAPRICLCFAAPITGPQPRPASARRPNCSWGPTPPSIGRVSVDETPGWSFFEVVMSTSTTDAGDPTRIRDLVRDQLHTSEPRRLERFFLRLLLLAWQPRNTGDAEPRGTQAYAGAWSRDLVIRKTSLDSCGNTSGGPPTSLSIPWLVGFSDNEELQCCKLG